ncbi:MAG: PTS sugar transporter subunit IIC [Elusimicrobia bacterium]|nr:PTS sugar transporter subunit IIC [Candidatus Liberimonas magnetica]
MFELISLSGLAAIFSLDVTAFGQFMISRPIVVCPIFGYLLGDIKSGLWLGMIIELIWTKEIPMGAAIPHDSTSVAILTSIWGIGSPFKQNSVLILSLALAAIAGILFKYTEIWIRNINIKIVHWIEEGIKRGEECRIDEGIYLGLFLFFIKAFLFYIILIPVGQSIINKVYVHLSIQTIKGLDLAWWFLPMTGFTVILINYNYKFLKIKK